MPVIDHFEIERQHEIAARISHRYDDTRPDIWGRKCRVCGNTAGHPVHDQLGIVDRDPGDEDDARTDHATGPRCPTV